MRQDVILEPIKQRRAVKRLVRRTRMHPIGEGHGDEIQSLIQEAGCGGGIDVVDDLAGADQKLVGQAFQRTTAGEGGRGQRVERADALLQKFSRHLQDRLRKTVVEAQLVGAGGVVNDELSRGDDGIAAVLIHAVDAVVAQRQQHVILAGACDPGWRAEHPLGAGIDAGKRRAADRGLRNRAPKPLPHIGVAIETDKGIADDVLPDRKASIRN